MADNCLQRDVNGGKIVPKGRVKFPTQEDKVARERDRLGRLVRELWIGWAEKQPSPKPSWLVPYHELSESDKEADRVIGYGLLAEFNAEMTGERLEHERLLQIAEELRTQLHGFRQLFDQNDPDSGRAITAFDEFSSRSK
jgi:hypothetical protein